jgi:hypothetical protein
MNRLKIRINRNDAILAEARGGNEVSLGFARYAQRSDNCAAMPPDPPVAAESPVAPPVAEREPNLLRFGLRQWFSFVSAIVILCALLARLEGVGPIVLGSVVALIAAHVFGTFLGTRLRDTSGEVYRWKGRAGSPDSDTPVASRQPIALEELALPAATSLADRTSDGKRSRAALALGGLSGLLLGGWGIHLLAGPTATWPGLALGAASCGVIGAWTALLWISFWAIIREAWRHASKED